MAKKKYYYSILFQSFFPKIMLFCTRSTESFKLETKLTMVS